MQKNQSFNAFKRILTKSKNFIDAEKEEYEKKKHMKNKSIKPKGFLARQLGVITFWLLFGFMFLVVMVTVFSNDSSGKAKQQEKTIVQKNSAASAEAIQYGKDFIESYFTWNIAEEEKAKRKETMSKFLAMGLDPYAGLNYNGLEWNSVYKGSELKKVTEKGDNLAHITYLVDFELTKNDSDEAKQLQKYFIVPVAYDGKTFGVYELPKFTYLYEDTTLKEVATTKLKDADAKDSEEIRDFLITFYRSYAEDSKDKLNYILASEDVTDGLNKSMMLKEVNKSSIFKGEKENTFIVFTEVTFTEPVTNVPLKSNYQLSIVKKDGRYIVSGIDDFGNKEIKTKGPVDVKNKTEENEKNEQLEG